MRRNKQSTNQVTNQASDLGAREPEVKEIGEEFVLTIYRPD